VKALTLAGVHAPGARVGTGEQLQRAAAADGPYPITTGSGSAMRRAMAAFARNWRGE